MPLDIQEDGSRLAGFEPLVLATQEHLVKLEAEMDGKYPLLTEENLEAFRTGELSLARINLAGNAGLVAKALGILLHRARNEHDDLYCTHAGEGHPGTYTDTIKSFFEPGKPSRWEVQEITRTDGKSGYVWKAQRFVLLGEQRTREAFIPAPMKAYFDRKGRPSLGKKELIQLLADPSRNVFSGVLMAIYLGVHPKDLIPIYSQDRIPDGLFANQRVMDRLRASVGKLDAATIRRIKETVYLLPAMLLAEGEDDYYPSFAPNSFVEAVDLLMENSLIPESDESGLGQQGLGFVRYNHSVVPTLVLRGASEVAQTTDSVQGLYGDPRTTKVLSLYGSQCTTNIVTAYFNFESGAKVVDEQ